MEQVTEKSLLHVHFIFSQRAEEICKYPTYCDLMSLYRAFSEEHGLRMDRGMRELNAQELIPLEHGEGLGSGQVVAFYEGHSVLHHTLTVVLWPGLLTPPKLDGLILSEFYKTQGVSGEATS